MLDVAALRVTAAVPSVRDLDLAPLRRRRPRRVGADLLKTQDPVPRPSGSPEGVRTKNFLYVEHASGEVELYDMRTDPGQLTNLAGQASYAPDEEALARTLDKLRNCRGGACQGSLPPRLRS